MQTTNARFILTFLIISYFTMFSFCLKMKNQHYKKATEEGFTGDPKDLFDYGDFFSKSIVKNRTETKDSTKLVFGDWPIHDLMIKDESRTLAYRDAIFKNAEVFKDKIVLEVGAGSGILCIFAAQAGAKHVYAFEYSDFADVAIRTVADNGLSDKITIIKKKVEEGELPVDKVDIIISEWMYAFLFGENMISAVFYARDKWLKKDGLILPDRGAIQIAAIHSKKLARFVDYYDNVYGVKIPAMKNLIKKSNRNIIDVEPEDVVSSVDTIFEFDIYKMKPEDVNFASSYSLKFQKDTRVTALASWWFVEFNLPNKVVLSTDPKAKKTVWKQDVMFLEHPFKVAKGETLNGSISIVRSEYVLKKITEVKFSYHYNGKFGKIDFVQQLINHGSSAL